MYTVSTNHHSFCSIRFKAVSGFWFRVSCSASSGSISHRMIVVKWKNEISKKSFQRPEVRAGNCIGTWIDADERGERQRNECNLQITQMTQIESGTGAPRATWRVSRQQEPRKGERQRREPPRTPRTACDLNRKPGRTEGNGIDR